jgi:hypothetical protein
MAGKSVFIHHADKHSGELAGSKELLYSGTVLVVRGLLLWVIVPATVLAWLIALPVHLGARVITGRWLFPRLRQLIAWSDEYLIISIERTLLRPMHLTCSRPDFQRGAMMKVCRR